MRRTVPLFSAVLILTLAPLASAHEDSTVAAGTYDLGPGATLTVPFEAHYHRLVGEARVLTPQGGAVSLGVTRAGGAPMPLGMGGDFALNSLIPCCKGTSWTAHTLHIENAGAAPVRVEVRVVALHDNLAVTVDDAEGGAAATMVAIFGAIAGVPAFLHFRAGRAADDSRKWLMLSASFLGAMWLLAAVLALVGMVRYGGGPIDGTLAATAHLPRFDNPFMNTHSIVLLTLIGLWGAALATWSGAARRTGDPLVTKLGLVLGFESLGVSVLWGIESGGVLVPALAALVSASYPLAVILGSGGRYHRGH